MASSVLPQPAGPQMSVERPRGNPAGHLVETDDTRRRLLEQWQIGRGAVPPPLLVAVLASMGTRLSIG